MTFTSDERREVAERLRRQARWMNKNKDWYDKDDVDQGNRAYRNIADSVEEGSNFSNHYEETVRKLADLIDRPTTTRHGKFKTKYGRETPCCEVCGYSIGDMRWNYCPKCGAEVIK